MSNTMASLKNINDKLKTMKEAISTKIDKNTKQLPINELNVGGSIVLGTMGDIMELLTLVTPKKHGIMSMEDKIKLDGIEPGSNKYIHPSTHSADMIVENDGRMFISKTEKEYLHNHNHDSRYYTETEVNNLLSGKSNNGHTHDDRYYTEAEVNNLLSKKANTSHGNHVPTYENIPTNRMRFLHASGKWSDVSASLLNTYTKEEISGLFTQFAKNLDWKESVNTRADLEKTYPNPEDGWTVNVKDDNYTYRWDGKKWAVIGGNAYVHPSTHPASMITTDSSRMFVTQAQIDSWNAKANANHGYHIPKPETAVANKFLRNDNTWQSITASTVGALASSGKAVDSSKLNGVSNSTGASANTIAQRDSAGDINVRLVRSNYGNETRMTGAVAFRVNTSDNYIRFCSDTNAFRAWLSTYSKSEVDSKLNRKANSSHGNHVPSTESANNARFLRNDNTWQTVTPGNIGAYTKNEIDSHWTPGTRDGWYQRYATNVSGDVNVLFKDKKTGFFCGSSLTNQMPWGNHSWRHYIVTSHANSDGYTGMIGMNFDGDEIGFKAICYGADKGWKRIWHSGNSNVPGHIGDSNIHKNWGLFRTNGGQDFLGRDKRCIVATTGEMILNYSNDFTQVNVHSNLIAKKTYNAIWNDYAELFPKLQSSKTEPGDIISLNINTDKEYYCKATKESSSFIVGVHSDEYAHLIGGDQPNSPDRSDDLYEFNKDHFIPVGLAGRVRAKCYGVIKRGDKLVISEDFPGVARAFNPNIDNPMDIFGMAVENKTDTDTITRVKMFIK